MPIKFSGCPSLAKSGLLWFNARLSQGQIAQLVEQRTENPCVGSSILPLATKFLKPLSKAAFSRPIFTHMPPAGSLKTICITTTPPAIGIAAVFWQTAALQPACRRVLAILRKQGNP